MSKPNPAGEAWVQKLEAWLAANQHVDIIYTIAVGHRDGYTTLLSNLQERAALSFLDTFAESSKMPAIFSSETQGKKS